MGLGRPTLLQWLARSSTIPVQPAEAQNSIGIEGCRGDRRRVILYCADEERLMLWMSTTLLNCGKLSVPRTAISMSFAAVCVPATMQWSCSCWCVRTNRNRQLRDFSRVCTSRTALRIHPSVVHGADAVLHGRGAVGRPPAAAFLAQECQHQGFGLPRGRTRQLAVDFFVNVP
jgi:hypothetical protein